MARLPEFEHKLKVGYTLAQLREYVKNDTKTKAHERAVKKEYQRLRKITLKRAERLARSDFKHHAPALKAKSLVRRLKYHQNIGIEGMTARLAEMEKFLSMRGSTIKGAREIRREHRERLEYALGHYDEDKGEYVNYKFKNYKEFELFTQFMDYIRALYKDNFQYNVDEVEQVFSDYSEQVLSKSITFSQFVDLYQNKYRTTPQVLDRPKNFK